jgi:hypothetical protein
VVYGDCIWTGCAAVGNCTRCADADAASISSNALALIPANGENAFSLERNAVTTSLALAVVN